MAELTCPSIAGLQQLGWVTGWVKEARRVAVAQLAAKAWRFVVMPLQRKYGRCGARPDAEAVIKRY